MKYKSLLYKSKLIIDNAEINPILLGNDFSWLVDCEFEEAEIEIKNNTIIWKSGTFYSGNWYYGIWESGDFHGIWESGIWMGGEFKGKMIGGLN